jgi:hypothetical protein
VTSRPASFVLAALAVSALAWPAHVEAQAPVRPQGRVDCNFTKANRAVPAAAVIAPTAPSLMRPGRSSPTR